MAERETSQSIDASAAEWVAREDRGALSEEDMRALQLWLEGDPRRPGALLRARAVSMRSEGARALGTGYDPQDFRPVREAPVVNRGLTRRNALIWSSAAAACLVIAGVAGSGLVAPEAHATDLGEVRLVPLKDGSTVMLNTETRVTVKFDQTHRLVKLVQGEADFRVVPEEGREFVVEAGGQVFRTDNGAFRVRYIKGAPLDVLVYQGRVDASLPEATRTASVPIETNSRLIVDTPRGAKQKTSVSTQPVQPEVVTRELAWREGKIAFKGETLAEAARTFARYSSTNIVIEDPDLAGETVTGVFAASDPVGFGRAVAAAFGANAIVQDEQVILKRDPLAD